MRLLVTGGGGFVGRQVVYAAVMDRQPGDSIVSVDRRQPPTYGNESVALDLCDSEAVTELVHALQPTHVVHCAGVTHSDTVDGYLTGNVATTHTLLRAIADVGRSSLERFVNVSSAAVYGPRTVKKCPIREDSPLAPATTYGWSKMVQERIASGFGREWDLPVVNARVFNITGPGQSPFMMPAAFMRRLIVEDEATLSVRKGGARRDFLDVRDVADALLVLMEKGSFWETYNVGSSVRISIAELATISMKASGIWRGIRPDAEGWDWDWSEANVSRLAALGWSPQISLSQSLADCWEWVRAITPEPDPEST